jgi:hypothetical protein
MTNMDKKFLEEKGLLKEAKRFNYIMEYVTGGDNSIEEVDGNGDGLDDATGMADPAAGGAMPGADPMAGGTAPGADPMAGGMPGADPNAAAGAAPAADPSAAAGGVPGFDPQPVGKDEDPNATAEESFDEATPDNPDGGEDEEVIDVDELVDGQKRNEDAISQLTDKFERFLEKFSEFQGELKSNAEFMKNLESEFEKRNPTSVEKLTMRSLQSKPFQETPEEYMENDAPENYSPEDDQNGVGEPRYTITRDDVRNATDYSSIAKTLRDNENSTLKTLLGL